MSLFQDVFTVSVGNLPPKAKVLIKITYITELSIQGTVAVFFMPATVAPWQQDRALNENIQVRVLETETSFFVCDVCLGEKKYPKAFGLFGRKSVNLWTCDVCKIKRIKTDMLKGHNIFILSSHLKVSCPCYVFMKHRKYKEYK